MRIPQVTDRMRQAPANALRAVFTGIGQMFVAAERLKEQGGQPAAAGQAAAGQPARSAAGGNVPGQKRRPGQAPDWSSRRAAGQSGPAGGSATQGGPAAGAGRGGKPAGGPALHGAPGATQAAESDQGARGKGRDRSRKSGTAPPPTRWRSLDQTGNVRLLSAEDLALEYPNPPAATPTPAPASAPTPAPAPAVPETPASQSPAPDGTTSAPAPDAADGVASPSENFEETTPEAEPVALAQQPTASVIHDEPTLTPAPEPAERAERAEPPAREEPSATFAAEPAARDEPLVPVVPEPVAHDDLPVPGYDGLSLPSLRARLRNLDADQLRMLADYERSHAAREDVVTMFERRIEKLAAEG